jgi:hypothetical protein
MPEISEERVPGREGLLGQLELVVPFQDGGQIACRAEE